MKRTSGIARTAAVLLGALAGCSRSPEPPGAAPGAGAPARRVRAIVSILPQAYFVERVGAEHVNVDVLVQPSQSPHSYEPTPKQMAALSKADVFFRIGVPFEEVVMRKIGAAYRDLNVVDTRRGIRLRRMKSAHPHDHHGKHEQEAGADPHVWLDPVNVRAMAATIADEFERLDPQHADAYKSNLKAFQADLDAVHARIAQTLAPLKGRKFYVFHPAFGYFGDRYGLEQEPVEIEGKQPSAKQLAHLITDARKEGVKVLFVQPQFAATSANKIAQSIGGAVVRIDPLARDCLKNLQDIAAKLEEALADQK